ncbi:hypothetical protein L207DRAFT_489150 [Hyaloscypha variabilis F]|uniref:DUF7907 domain-containing protein n=1 Tax=Hyaloscypha variabilis (strain UAMH 11265 / GT02V1 / F) TaxID=1149755 RepID=A0A2J6RLI8_HYAVF|nr:hypothetical protein L207DRAFT_489150 [Hyaloscypha variabilis F]
MFTFASSLPSDIKGRQTWVPGRQNNTQEFYISMVVTNGCRTYEGWTIETYHTGAGMADPVFTPNATSRAFLNGTNLQFDVNSYPFSLDAFPSDTNYARWESTSITAGFGSGSFYNDGPNGIQVDNPEHDGWIVCEWYHGDNAPQLFQMIEGFDDVGLNPDTDIPATCSRALLIPQWI